MRTQQCLEAINQPTVGADLSRPAPMYRPGGNPLPTRMHVLKLMIGLRLLHDHGATGRYIGAGRGKPAPTVGCLPTTISYTRPYSSPLSELPPSATSTLQQK